MVEINSNISLMDYVKIKIGPETGRGHTGHYNTFLSVADKVTTPDQAEDIRASIDAVADAVRMDGGYSLRGQSGQRYTVERPSQLIGVVLKLLPYLGQGLDVERVVEEIKSDLRQIEK